MLDKLKLLWSKTNRWHIFLLVFVIVESKLVPSGQYGFHCNDPALSHPFTGDTVSWKWLLATTFLLPLAVMLVVERQYHSDKESTRRSRKQALCWYKEYSFGALVNLTIIQTLKLLVGSPRPHFFDTCRPEEAMTCEGSEYISSYRCTKAQWLSQSDRSFPSGHTSLALHAGLFIAYYLHRRTHHTGSWTIMATQAACVLAAVCCALSRMTDHRHHWWDVLAGAAITAPVLLYTILSLCHNFEREIAISEKTTENNSINHQNITETADTVAS